MVIGMVSPKKLFPHLFPQNVPARANTSGERTIIPETAIKVCCASKPRFFFLEIRHLRHLMTSDMYCYILTVSGRGIGHRFRQVNRYFKDLRHFNTHVPK
jgi:hypothetical protein